MKNNYRYFTNTTSFGDNTKFIAANATAGFIVNKSGNVKLASDTVSLKVSLNFVDTGAWKEISFMEALSLVPELSWVSIIKRLSSKQFKPIRIGLTSGGYVMVYTDSVDAGHGNQISFVEFEDIAKAIKEVKQFLIDNPQ
jgi:hypothetical protein